MILPDIVKPLIIFASLSGVPGFSAADADDSRALELNVQSQIKPAETQVSGLRHVYSSDQGIVVILGSRVVLLEGLDSQAWRWLVSQIGMVMLIKIVNNTLQYQFYRNENAFSETTLGFVAQLFFSSVVVPGLSFTVFVRSIWKQYKEVGMWSIMGGSAVGYLVAGNQQAAFNFAMLSVVFGVYSRTRYMLASSEHGSQRLYLRGSEASNLLISIDYDTDNPTNSTKISVSRVNGSLVENIGHSEFSALASAMDMHKVSTLHIEAFSMPQDELGNLIVSYTDAKGVLHKAGFSFGHPDNHTSWLVNLAHQRVPFSAWPYGKSVLSPAAIGVITHWLECSTSGDYSGFRYGKSQMIYQADKSRKFIISLDDDIRFDDIDEVDATSVKLGKKYRLVFNELSSLKELIIPSEPKSEYVQYRIPRWWNHFLLIAVVGGASKIAGKGIDFATKKMFLPDGVTMEELKIAYDETGPKAALSRFADRVIHKRDLDGARAALNLDENSTLDELTKSYRQLTLQFHPDRHPGEPQLEVDQAETMFKRIGSARKIVEWFLKNPEGITVIDEGSSDFWKEMYKELDKAGVVRKF